MPRRKGKTGLTPDKRWGINHGIANVSLTRRRLRSGKAYLHEIAPRKSKANNSVTFNKHEILDQSIPSFSKNLDHSNSLLLMASGGRREEEEVEGSRSINSGRSPLYSSTPFTQAQPSSQDDIKTTWVQQN